MMGLTKTLAALICAGFIALFVALCVTAWVAWSTAQPFSPLLDYSVMAVQNEGHKVKAGDEVVMISTRCNNGTTEPVAVVGYALFASREAGDVKRVQINLPLPFNRPPGCDTRTFRIKLPADVTPGVWRVEAVDTVVRGTQSQVKPYWSEDFTVVP